MISNSKILFDDSLCSDRVNVKPKFEDIAIAEPLTTRRLRVRHSATKVSVIRTLEVQRGLDSIEKEPILAVPTPIHHTTTNSLEITMNDQTLRDQILARQKAPVLKRANHPETQDLDSVLLSSLGAFGDSFVSYLFCDEETQWETMQEVHDILNNYNVSHQFLFGNKVGKVALKINRPLNSELEPLTLGELKTAMQAVVGFLEWIDCPDMLQIGHSGYFAVTRIRGTVNPVFRNALTNKDVILTADSKGTSTCKIVPMDKIFPDLEKQRQGQRAQVSQSLGQLAAQSQVTGSTI